MHDTLSPGQLDFCAANTEGLIISTIYVFCLLKKDESDMETNDVIPGLRSRQISAPGRLTGFVCVWLLNLGEHLDSG